MLKIEQTRQFKCDYKREKRGRHRTTLEAAFVEVLKVLVEPLREKVSAVAQSAAAVRTDLSNKESELPEACRYPLHLEAGIEKTGNQVKVLT